MRGLMTLPQSTFHIILDTLEFEDYLELYKVNRHSRVLISKFLAHHCRTIRASSIPHDSIRDQLSTLLSMCHRLRHFTILPWLCTAAVISRV